MIRTALLLVALLASAAPAAGQVARVPGGGTLLEWMGLEPGDSFVLEGPGGRSCVTVGAPFRAEGGRWAPLRGLPWPGLASDSRIVVPLDGALDLAVVRTPGPRPRPVSLLPAGAHAGWSIGAGGKDDPDVLVYRHCAMCSDAGTTVILERGRGIRSIAITTIAGTETLARVDDALCAEREGDR